MLQLSSAAALGLSRVIDAFGECLDVGGAGSRIVEPCNGVSGVRVEPDDDFAPDRYDVCRAVTDLDTCFLERIHAYHPYGIRKMEGMMFGNMASHFLRAVETPSAMSASVSIFQV